MSLRALLESPAVEKPFSVCADRKYVLPGRNGLPSICENRCSSKLCYAETRAGEFTCLLGVRYVSRTIGELPLVAFGLAPLDRASKIPSLKGRGFPREYVDTWFRGVEKLHSMLEGQVLVGRTSALDSVHDISRLASEVLKLSDELVRSSLPVGASIDSAPALHLSILKTAELLTKEFDRLELLANPASASVGKMYVHIYKLFHKYVIISNLAHGGGQRRRVAMKGRSDRTLPVYESISVLAWALVENAAKYAFGGETVDVEVIDAVGAVTVAVQSTGPLIEQDEIPLIFDKNVRGKWAKRLGAEGRGLGLHLAKIVADAHQTRIEVSSRGLGYERDGVPAAENRFSVHIAAIG